MNAGRAALLPRDDPDVAHLGWRSSTSSYVRTRLDVLADSYSNVFLLTAATTALAALLALTLRSGPAHARAGRSARADGRLITPGSVGCGEDGRTRAVSRPFRHCRETAQCRRPHHNRGVRTYLGLAWAGVRHRPGSWLLLALGIALATALPIVSAGLRAESSVAAVRVGHRGAAAGHPGRAGGDRSRRTRPGADHDRRADPGRFRAGGDRGRAPLVDLPAAVGGRASGSPSAGSTAWTGCHHGDVRPVADRLSPDGVRGRRGHRARRRPNRTTPTTGRPPNSAWWSPAGSSCGTSACSAAGWCRPMRRCCSVRTRARWPTWNP